MNYSHAEITNGIALEQLNDPHDVVLPVEGSWSLVRLTEKLLPTPLLLCICDLLLAVDSGRTSVVEGTVLEQLIDPHDPPSTPEQLIRAVRGVAETTFDHSSDRERRSRANTAP